MSGEAPGDLLRRPRPGGGPQQRRRPLRSPGRLHTRVFPKLVGCGGSGFRGGGGPGVVMHLWRFIMHLWRFIMQTSKGWRIPSEKAVAVSRVGKPTRKSDNRKDTTRGSTLVEENKRALHPVRVSAQRRNTSKRVSAHRQPHCRPLSELLTLRSFFLFDSQSPQSCRTETRL